MRKIYRVILTNHIVLYARFTYVESYQNILEHFCTKNAVLTIGLMDQSGYSLCLLYGQTFHPCSTTKKPNKFEKCIFRRKKLNGPITSTFGPIINLTNSS